MESWPAARQQPRRRPPPHGGGGKRGCIKAHEPNTCYTTTAGVALPKVDRSAASVHCARSARSSRAPSAAAARASRRAQEEAERAKASLWGQYLDLLPPPPPSVPPSRRRRRRRRRRCRRRRRPTSFRWATSTFRDAIAATPAPLRGCRLPSAGRRRRRRRRRRCCSRRRRPMRLPSRPPAPSSPSLVPHLRTHLTANHRLATQISLGSRVSSCSPSAARAPCQASGDDAADRRRGWRRAAADASPPAPRRPTTKKGRGRYESVAVGPPSRPPRRRRRGEAEEEEEKEKRGRGAPRAAVARGAGALDQDSWCSRTVK